MHNVFQHSRSHSLQKPSPAHIPYPSTSLSRVTLWTERHLDPSLTRSTRSSALHEGAIPLVHPSFHDFRGKSDRKNVYVRRYQPAKDRATHAEEDYQGAHLEAAPYVQINSLETEHWLLPTSHTRPLQLVLHRFRTQNARERVISKVKTMRGMGGETVDRFKIDFPVLREKGKCLAGVWVRRRISRGS